MYVHLVNKPNTYYENNPLKLKSVFIYSFK